MDNRANRARYDSLERVLTRACPVQRRRIARSQKSFWRGAARMPSGVPEGCAGRLGLRVQHGKNDKILPRKSLRQIYNSNNRRDDTPPQARNSRQDLHLRARLRQASPTLPRHALQHAGKALKVSRNARAANRTFGGSHREGSEADRADARDVLKFRARQMGFRVFSAQIRRGDFLSVLAFVATGIRREALLLEIILPILVKNLPNEKKFLFPRN